MLNSFDTRCNICLGLRLLPLRLQDEGLVELTRLLAV